MSNMQQLAAIIARHAPETGLNATRVPRLTLFRADRPTMPTPSVYEASLCLIAQGAKRVSAGEQTLLYDVSSYLVVSTARIEMSS